MKTYYTNSKDVARETAATTGVAMKPPQRPARAYEREEPSLLPSAVDLSLTLRSYCKVCCLRGRPFGWSGVDHSGGEATEQDDVQEWDTSSDLKFQT